MHHIDYIHASVPQLQAHLESLGLSTSVRVEDAAEYKFHHYTEALQPLEQVSEPYLRLVYLGRLAKHLVDEETTPPSFVVDWARRAGLVEYAEPGSAIQTYSASVIHFLQGYVSKYSTYPTHISFLGRTFVARLDGCTADGFSSFKNAIRQNSIEDQNDPLMRVFTAPIDRPHWGSIAACHIDEAKGFAGFVMTIPGQPGKWIYVKVGSRILGTASLPDPGHRALDFSDLTGFDEHYYNLHGTLYHRLLRLPLQQLGVSLTPSGFYQKSVLPFAEETLEVNTGISIIVLPHVIGSLTEQRPSTYGSRWAVPTYNTDASSLGNYLRLQTIRNRMLRPCTLCLDSNFQYKGPEEYLQDPVTALVIAYAQENREKLVRPEDPSLKYYHGTTLDTLQKFWQSCTGFVVDQAVASASLAYQARQCKRQLVELGKADAAGAASLGSGLSPEQRLQQALRSKSLLEVMALA